MKSGSSRIVVLRLKRRGGPERRRPLYVGDDQASLEAIVAARDGALENLTAR